MFYKLLMPKGLQRSCIRWVHATDISQFAILFFTSTEQNTYEQFPFSYTHKAVMYWDILLTNKHEFY